MRTLQLVVLLVVVDNVGHVHLLSEALLVNRLFGHVGLDHVEFSQMPPAGTVSLNVAFFPKVLEVRVHETAGGLVKVLFALSSVGGVALGLGEVSTVGSAVPVLHLVAAHSGLELGLELGFGGGR